MPGRRTLHVLCSSQLRACPGQIRFRPAAGGGLRRHRRSRSDWRGRVASAGIVTAPIHKEALAAAGHAPIPATPKSWPIMEGRPSRHDAGERGHPHGPRHHPLFVVRGDPQRRFRGADGRDPAGRCGCAGARHRLSARRCRRPQSACRRRRSVRQTRKSEIIAPAIEAARAEGIDAIRPMARRHRVHAGPQGPLRHRGRAISRPGPHPGQISRASTMA